MEEHLETEQASSLLDWLKSVSTKANSQLILERLGVLPGPLYHLNFFPPVLLITYSHSFSSHHHHCKLVMDRASQVLADGLPAGVPTTYLALSNWGQVPYSTVYHRAHGRPSREDKAKSQQYLTPSEEKALVKYTLRMRSLGFPIRMKHLPSLAFIIARRRSMTDGMIKPPGKNWPKAFEKRHPELKSRKVKAVDWNRHDSNIYEKITHWFEVIGKELQDPDILPENVYNMDETGVMLCMLGSVKVLVSKDDAQDYRGAGVERTMVTAIECISGDGRSLFPMTGMRL